MIPLLLPLLQKLDKHQLVALISCLIPVEKSVEQIKLTSQMAEPLAALQVGRGRSWLASRI